MTEGAASVRARAAGVLDDWRRWLPLGARALVVVTYPFWFDVSPFSYLTDDALGPGPRRRDPDGRLRDARARAEHRRRATRACSTSATSRSSRWGRTPSAGSPRTSSTGSSWHFLSTAPEGAAGIHLNMWLVLLLGGVVAAIAGVIIGWPTLRLRGDYLAIVTLGFGEIIPDVFRNADSAAGAGWPAGRRRRSSTSRRSTSRTASAASAASTARVRREPRHGQRRCPSRSGSPASDLNPWYFTIVVMVLITIFVVRRLERSKMGRAWIAVREDEIAASAMGVPLMRTKLWAYGIGAIFGGIVGAYYGSFIGSVFPTSFSFAISILVLGHGRRRRHGEHLRRDPRRAPARVPELQGPREDRRRHQQRDRHRRPRDDGRHPEVQDADLRAPARDHDAAATRGSSAERTPQGRAARGRRRGRDTTSTTFARRGAT